MIRFDDLRSGSGLVSGRLGEIWRADRLDEVVGVLSAAHRAARSGSWVAGFVAYEAASAFDDALVTKAGRSGLPLAWFAACELATEMAIPAAAARPFVGWEPDIDRRRYQEDLTEIRRRIAAGDTYQVNHTFQMTAPAPAEPLDLYAAMANAQHGAYAAYLDTGDWQIASASPELFFELDGRRIVTRPMKGTAARGRWWKEDEAAGIALSRSSKDRAENLMIVDLLRNDLGRLAEFGSVNVDELFSVERYDTVWQMTSQVSALTRPEVDLSDVFRALFPCGSVTGAPKSSTMRIIAEREAAPRGVYCGAIGFIEPGGERAVFSVPIRTAVIDAQGGATYGVGGGVTWDSSPEGEWQEALLKAQVLTSPVRDFMLLETMRWEPDAGIVNQRQHLDRLERSARYFGFPFDRRDIESALAVLDDPTPRRVRLTLGRDEELEIVSGPLSAVAEPIRLGIDDAGGARTSPLWWHKTTDRRHYDAASDRHPEADEVVLVNERGEVCETTISSLVVELDGRWVTPPLESGLLPGTARGALLESGDVVEQTVLVDDLRRATAVHVVNAVRGRRAAILVP